jgi:hypothetical protein
MSLSKPSRRPEIRQAKYSGKNTINMAVDLSAFNAVIAKIEGDITKALRPAAQAGAEVIYRAVLQNVEKIGSVTGNLRSSIYQAFSKDNSTQAPGGGYSKATYHVSWNAKKAPHGHLIEYGHIQRYAVHLGKDGKWHTVVRPNKRGTPKPSRRASQAVKDAYYVLRPGGPVQQPARPFLRPAFYKQGEAIAAVEAAFWRAMKQ